MQLGRSGSYFSCVLCVLCCVLLACGVVRGKRRYYVSETFDHKHKGRKYEARLVGLAACLVAESAGITLGYRRPPPLYSLVILVVDMMVMVVVLSHQHHVGYHHHHVDVFVHV